MKVGVSVGMTLCTDPENRNFAKFGFELSDIDTEGDIEAQTQEGVAAMLKVHTAVNEGMEQAVVVSLTDLHSVNPEGVRDDLDRLFKSVGSMRERLIPNIVARVRQISEVAVVPGQSLSDALKAQTPEAEGEADAGAN